MASTTNPEQSMPSCPCHHHSYGTPLKLSAAATMPEVSPQGIMEELREAKSLFKL